jgi:hypothetical protein
MTTTNISQNHDLKPKISSTLLSRQQSQFKSILFHINNGKLIAILSQHQQYQSQSYIDNNSTKHDLVSSTTIPLPCLSTGGWNGKMAWNGSPLSLSPAWERGAVPPKNSKQIRGGDIPCCLL